MFDRIATSFSLARSSWDVLRKDKQLLLFPVVSGIACTVVLVSFLIPLGVVAYLGGFKGLQNADGNVQAPWWSYLVLFAFYFCNYFVVIFCNSALVGMRHHALQRRDADAGRRLPRRRGTAAADPGVGAGVGHGRRVLKLIENGHRRVGKFISAILGTAWTIMTYFVVPVLVVEKLGPIQAVGRSVALLKKTWGEALIGHFGLGFFKFLACLPLLLLIGLGAALCFSANGAAPLIVAGIAVFVIAAVYFLAYLAVASAMDTIFLSALYQYAAFQTVPIGFDAGTIERAFQPKR